MYLKLIQATIAMQLCVHAVLAIPQSVDKRPLSNYEYQHAELHPASGVHARAESTANQPENDTSVSKAMESKLIARLR